ncbi:MAG: hypothetical protein ABI769_08815 [Pseudomonadota bacterium]
MNISNLALRLEEFSVAETSVRADARQSPQMFVVTPRGAARRAQRPLQLGAYRIQIRDTGLRPFRVF